MNEIERARFSVSQIKQGNNRFYTLSMPSEVLTTCCFATSQEEDPVTGFQRTLDESRARDIAKYIDEEGGSIPSAIILSAQKSADLKIIGQGKTLEFNVTPHAFLIIDGQHRLWGFHFSASSLRVPVVIYNDLTKAEEAKLFIDVNTKQRPVPKELLLAINKLADRESSVEALLANVFDIFDSDPSSALLGLLSSAKASKTAISRVTFNAGLTPLLSTFEGKSAVEIYEVLNPYFHSITKELQKIELFHLLVNKTVFRSFMSVFVPVAQRVSLAGKAYSADSFGKIIKPFFKLKPSTFEKATDIKTLSEKLENSLNSGFKI